MSVVKEVETAAESQLDTLVQSYKLIIEKCRPRMRKAILTNLKFGELISSPLPTATVNTAKDRPTFGPPQWQCD